MDNPDMPSTLGAVYRLLSSSGDVGELFTEILENQTDLTSQMAMDLANFAAKAPKEQSGVKSNLLSAMRIFSNPVVDAATSKSDFSIHDLRKKKNLGLCWRSSKPT